MTPLWRIIAEENIRILFERVPWRVPGRVSHKAGLITTEYDEGWEW